MSELALDDDERDTFVCHVDGVGVPWLMRREPAPNARCGGRVM